jgi:hypothetical protein
VARSIQIERGPVRLSVSGVQPGAITIRHPRAGRLIASIVLVLAVLPLFPTMFVSGSFWAEPMNIAVVLLLMVPGLWCTSRAFRPRVVMTLTNEQVLVACGRAFFERPLLQFPIETVEVQVGDEKTMAACYDMHAVNKRILAGLNPFVSGKLDEQEVSVYVLQIRSKGQSQWLNVFGSRLASEIESAGLCVQQALDAPREEPEVEVEIDPEDNPD